MKAVLCTEWGGPERLVIRDVPSPPLLPNQVRIRVRACGINFADTLQIEGKYQVRPALPFTPGMEAAGEVLEAGTEAAGRFRAGQRVIAVSRFGGSYAEELVADSRLVVPIPDSMDFITAAGFPVAYGTSYLALTHRGRLRPGETLVVLGAAGGVGLTAVEIGKQLGARVIAAAGGAEKCAVARDHGADETIDYGQENLRDRIREITGGRGADVVYDPVGGNSFDQCLRAVAWGARLLVIGFAAGRIQAVPANLVLVKSVSVVGVAWGGQTERDPALIGGQLAELVGWHDAGRLRPRIGPVFPLDQAGAAMQALLSRRHAGKIVLTA